METYGIQPNNIPDDWKRLAQWVLWRRELVGGKPTKVPYMAAGRKAKTNDPATWDSFENVIIALSGELSFDGIGFVLTEYDPFCILDMDGCRNPDTGELKPEAANLVSQFATYTEITPSQTGVRVVLRGTKPGNGCQKAGVYGCSKLEIYDHLRFVTVTGNVLQSELLPVESRQRELDDLHVELFPPKSAKKGTERAFRPLPSQSGETSTPEILARAFRAKNGAAIQSLWRGDTSAHNADESRADLALCSYLAFYVGNDPARLDALFRESGLMREKWDLPRPGGTWGSNTIAESLKDKTEFWQPAGTAKPARKTPVNPVESPETSEATSDGELDERSAKAAEKARREAARAKRAVDLALMDGLPSIETNGAREHLRHVTRRAFAALLAANEPPRLFARGGSLARIAFDEESRPKIETLGVASLRADLSECANFISTSIDGNVIAVAPPAPVIDGILSARSLSGMPPLLGIVTAPVFSSTGTVETTPGYLASSALFYHAFDCAELPNSDPTPENIKEAKRLLIEEVFGDFPFDGSPSSAHALALTIQPFARPLISGPTPFYLVDAPTPGSGKGKIVEAATGIFIPRGAVPTPGDVKDDDEWRKRITTGLLSGKSHIWFDNINKRVDSGSLAAALTAGEWQDRLLGGNTETIIPVRCTWTGTGNNTQLSDELIRRTVYIRIVSELENPQERTGFRHPDLPGWIATNRPRLIAAVLTLVKAWIAAGMPAYSGKPLGSYENWCRVLGGILETVGIPGFLGNRNELSQKTNPDRDKWAGFLESWHAKFKDASVGVADLYENPDGSNGVAIDAGLVDGNRDKSRSEKVSLGKAIIERRDRVFGQFRIVSSGTLHRIAQYKCVSGVSGVSVSPHVREGCIFPQNAAAAAAATHEHQHNTKNNPSRTWGETDTPDTPDTPLYFTIYSIDEVREEKERVEKEKEKIEIKAEVIKHSVETEEEQITL